MRYRKAGEVSLRDRHPFEKSLEEVSFHRTGVSALTWSKVDCDLGRLLNEVMGEQGPIDGFKARRYGRVPDFAYYLVVKSLVSSAAGTYVLNILIYFFEHKGTVDGLMRELHVMEVMDS